jgi:hypothetical protein
MINQAMREIRRLLYDALINVADDKSWYIYSAKVKKVK